MRVYTLYEPPSLRLFERPVCTLLRLVSPILSNLDCRWTCKVSRCRRGRSSHGSCTGSSDCCSLSSIVGAGAPLRVQLVTGIGSNQPHPLQQWYLYPQHPHVHRRPPTEPPPGRPSGIHLIGGGGGGGGSAVSQRWPRKPAGQLHVNAAAACTRR